MSEAPKTSDIVALAKHIEAGGEWQPEGGARFRSRKSIGDDFSENPFEFLPSTGVWTPHGTPGYPPWTLIPIKERKPAPATLRDCVRAKHYRVKRHGWPSEDSINTNVALNIQREAERLTIIDLLATDWVMLCDNGEWISPNGGVEVDDGEDR